ncbi:uncharacterized protein Dere_GG10965 [Drosophila erecta]|uniref:Uncharacterized protein n=1 Tax=Drosophila erecta TaxID=7220 RepID=A0A0Q5UUL9_DROER|nr:uncharacterized protein Dere_GG10965 [Drosophila erecta]
MIPAHFLTTTSVEDNSKVAVILGGNKSSPCGEKALLMAPKVRLSSGHEMPVLDLELQASGIPVL